MSRLQQIQVATQQIAEAISSALDMDVTIVAEDMVRIAGTGRHMATVGQKIFGNHIYQKVVGQAEEFIVTDVKNNDTCDTCDKRPTCMELAQICCPILLGKEAIGVIGLIAFSRGQQQDIANKGRRLLHFLRKMAELISAKVAEQEGMKRLVLLKNQLETVLNFIAEGVIAIDHTANVISINFTAEKMLRVKGNDVIGFHINEVFPGTPITEVLREGVGFVDREVSIWHNGRRHHYLINAKPMLIDGSIEGVVASFRAASPEMPSAVHLKTTFDDICGASNVIEKVKSEARKAAQGVATVLISGESGTGKEVFARAIHFESERGAGPFVAVNCAAIPENLLESELFGYTEGSFTGARKGGKPGKFELANGGTLFLDEIGDMPLSLQVKMLRVLQEKVIDRVGSIRGVHIDVRIIAATNSDLEAMIRAGKFREDLYYRISVFPITLPPLRERSDDIKGLAAFFYRKYADFYGKPVRMIAPEAVKMLEEYKWPGNVRELENAMECAVIKMSGTVIEINDLPAKVLPDTANQDRIGEWADSERERIIKALDTFGTSVAGKTEAAASLGIGIATLYRKIRKYGLA